LIPVLKDYIITQLYFLFSIRAVHHFVPCTIFMEAPMRWFHLARKPTTINLFNTRAKQKHWGDARYAISIPSVVEIVVSLSIMVTTDEHPRAMSAIQDLRIRAKPAGLINFNGKQDRRVGKLDRG